MNKIIQINVDDIIIDPAGISEMITNACCHKIRMQVSGVCQTGDNILIVLDEESFCEKEYQYILAPFESGNVNDITGEISSRYFSGFFFVGGLDIKSEKWALFRTESK